MRGQVSVILRLVGDLLAWINTSPTTAVAAWGVRRGLRLGLLFDAAILATPVLVSGGLGGPAAASHALAAVAADAQLLAGMLMFAVFMALLGGAGAVVCFAIDRPTRQ